MRTYALPILAVLLVLLVATGVTKHLSASARQRNALSVFLVVLALLTAFFLFFIAGSLVRGGRSQPRPHASAPPGAFATLSPIAAEPASFQSAAWVGEIKPSGLTT
jgi:hypothetical protein